MKKTGITISKKTKHSLTNLGKKGESYDQLLAYVTKFLSSDDRFWENRT